LVLCVLVFGYGPSLTCLKVFCEMLIASGRSLLAAGIALMLIPLGTARVGHPWQPHSCDIEGPRTSKALPSTSSVIRRSTVS
jgi:hypothetical protein